MKLYNCLLLFGSIYMLHLFSDLELQLRFCFATRVYTLNSGDGSEVHDISLFLSITLIFCSCFSLLKTALQASNHI